VKALPLRIGPDEDLRSALEARAGDAGFVIAGVGSLHVAALRFAGRKDAQAMEGPLEILTLSGSLSKDGAHLHMSVSDSAGNVRGGHVGYGCRVRTTAEVLMADLPGWSFTREPDAATGYPELVIVPRPSIDE